MTNSLSRPIDLHAVYREQAACGYDCDLLLPQYAVQSLAARLRGINAVTAVLTAGDSSDVNLSEWMRAGLVEAIHAMSEDAAGILAEHNEYARKQSFSTNGKEG